MRAEHRPRPAVWRLLHVLGDGDRLRRWLLARRLRRVAQAIDRVDRLLANEFGTLDMAPLLAERDALERLQASLRTRFRGFS